MSTYSRRDFVKFMGIAAVSSMFPLQADGIGYKTANAVEHKPKTFDIKKGEYKIIPINNNTWCIQEANVRCFLLTGSKEALLIDSGNNIHNAKEIAQSLTNLPIKLLNTHADRDHIGSNNEFDEFYMSMAEASNYYHGQNRRGAIIPTEHGDKLNIGNRPLEIIGLPGHTPGSIAVLDVNNRALFSGDPIQDGEIYMFGVQREPHAYVLSLKRLEKYTGRFDTIYPAHSNCPVSPNLIVPLYKGVEEILAGKIQGTDAVLHNTPIKKFDVKVATILGDAKL
ncbi:MAG: MBL fold metallo-hydrolase [Selenomonadaceae bacterium]|nr:MBL fold metallo-hydrolase [Selenomonadaceae bacterium]